MKAKNLNLLKDWPKIAFVIGLYLLVATLVNGVLAQGPNLIQNGGFEDGFVAGKDVANEWGYFKTDNAAISFHDDAWALVVVEGDHSQMIEIAESTSADAYAGIYQTVVVEPSRTYELSFKGIVRSDAGSVEASSYGYRLQYAIDLEGNEDWRQVTKWIELPWDEQPRTGPEAGTGFRIDSLKTKFTTTGEAATVFIRAWKKWAELGEGNFNLDAVRVTAIDSEDPTAASPTPTPYRDPATEPLPETGGEGDLAQNMVWLIASAALILILLGSASLNQKRRMDQDQDQG